MDFQLVPKSVILNNPGISDARYISELLVEYQKSYFSLPHGFCKSTTNVYRSYDAK